MAQSGKAPPGPIWLRAHDRSEKEVAPLRPQPAHPICIPEREKRSTDEGVPAAHKVIKVTPAVGVEWSVESVPADTPTKQLHRRRTGFLATQGSENALMDDGDIQLAK